MCVLFDCMKELRIVNKDLILSNNKNLHKLFLEFIEVPAGWDIETISRSLINLIPGIGGAVETLLFANKDKKEIQKIISFLFILGKQFKKLEKNNLNIDYLKSDEYYFLLKRVLERIKYEFKYEKIQLFKNLLIKAAIINPDNQDLSYEYILSKIENLDVNHILIIKWYFDNSVFYKPNENYSKYANLKKIELPKITKYFIDYENDLAKDGWLESPGGAVMSDDSRTHYYYLSDIAIKIHAILKYDDVE